METCLLIDAYSLAFRAFFALPESMASSSGQVTNALYGFSKMMATLLKTYEPSHMAVAFDYPAPTFRDEIFAAYKGQRPPTPSSLKTQLQLLRPLVESLEIPCVELEGYEADDVIGTLACLAQDHKVRALIVTGDRDSFQLVRDPYITVLYNRRGVSEIDVMDAAAVRAKAGVTPELYSEYAALRGDPSDNLPGVRGIGEKTAAKLINEYGSIGALLEHLDSLPEKQRQAISEASEQLQRNSILSRIVTDAPLGVSFDELSMKEWNSSSAKEIFITLELRSSLSALTAASAYRRDLSTQEGVETQSSNQTLDLVDLEIVAPRDLEFSREAPLSTIALYDGSPGRSPLSAVAGWDGRSGKALVRGESVRSEDLRTAMAAAVDDTAIQGIETKELLRSLLGAGDVVPNVAMDLGLAEYLIDPGSRDLSLSSLAERYLGVDLDSPGEGQRSLFERSESVTVDDLRMRLSAVRALAPRLRTQLSERGLIELFETIELPLIRVLAKMEIAGIAVDRSALEIINIDLRTEVGSLLGEIWSEVGSEINPNSTQQLAHVLFEQLGLTPSKRTKTGFSTDAQTLERLRGEHRVVELVLRYRELEKLRSTFAEGLLSEIGADGRIHATFHQTVARTGRISSDRPNLHNIPIRSESGRRFREVFVAPVGRSLVVADYSQIELRVIAHLSQDENLLAALTSGRDLHVQTAAKVFGVPEGAVTPTQRSRAKMVAYGLAYGMESYGLAQRLAISNAEADEILKSFFQAFPGVRRYMDTAIEDARKVGYTRTSFGRRRYFTDLNSPNRTLRQAAERQAMNAGIQGLAADIFKIALVELDRRLEGLDAFIVLQVHDEVVVECASSDVSTVVTVVEEALSSAAQLSVPLEVEAHCGQSWASAKGQ